MKELRGIRRSGAKRSNDTVPGSSVLLSRGDKLLGTREVEERVGVVVGQQLGNSEIEERRSRAGKLLGELREALGCKRIVAAYVSVEGRFELLSGWLGRGGFAAQNKARR